jgi:tetratricopeptide (TPR) repeat protein
MTTRRLFIYSFAALLALNSCELLDPTEVVNPNLTEDAVLGTGNTMAPWLNGMQRQMALVTNAHVINAEIASDNYENTQTFYNQNLDALTIRPQDNDVQQLQFTLARLREMADYGLNVIADADESTTDEQLATLHFYKGYSYLISGMYFSFLPVEAEGEPVSDEALYGLAIEEFDMAINGLPSSDAIHKAALLGKARANYKLGNKAQAVAASDDLLRLDASFVFYVEFDQVQGPANVMQTALFDRGNFDDLQVLPRLDFLDPKYYFRGASEASPVAIFKAEEAHLIIAEAAVSDNMLQDAKVELSDLISLVASRPRSTFSNTQQDRTQRDPGSRPNASDIVVSASQGELARAGLVLTRSGGPITVPTVSGTSVTDAMLITATTEDQLLELIYLMRQEIFLGEGIRLSDMGVKLVISEIEYLANPNIDASHPGVTPVIPPFIDAIKDELDAFTYNAAVKTAVITHNVNRILVANKNSEFVLPFH